ncbi:hypothetical protein HCJ92_22175 [Streptomyces sp. ventii]|uniref:Uncharacterized protein n=1 Tax=Streptomyces spiramenti TaxID=2720606 RepID=A0ABX1AT64_9ACTN|nr:hypothetical protein [Streptomyces spiramenti]
MGAEPAWPSGDDHGQPPASPQDHAAGPGWNGYGYDYDYASQNQDHVQNPYQGQDGYGQDGYGAGHPQQGYAAGAGAHPGTGYGDPAATGYPQQGYDYGNDPYAGGDTGWQGRDDAHGHDHPSDQPHHYGDGNGQR